MESSEPELMYKIFDDVFEDIADLIMYLQEVNHA